MCETFSSYWPTIQPSLFNFTEDEMVELAEWQKLFVRVAESLDLRQIAARYLLMKHVWNWPEAKRTRFAFRAACGPCPSSSEPPSSTSTACISNLTHEIVQLPFG